LRKTNKKAVVLLLSILTLVILIVLGSAFILRTVGQRFSVETDKKSTQAFYLAEAGANCALNKLNLLINSEMLNNVSNERPWKIRNRAQRACGPAGEGGIWFLEQYSQFNDQGIYEGACDNPLQIGEDLHTVSYKITVTETTSPYCGVPDEGFNHCLSSQSCSPCSDQIWCIPFDYAIESSSSIESMKRNIVLSGDFTIQIQHDNFARYALFTDHHRMESGTTVWFTDDTNFTGPLHTNERYSFYSNPTFDGLVTQHIQNARFYDDWPPILLDADSNPPHDIPVFNSGYERGANEINLASSVTQQDLQEQAYGEIPGALVDGIYVPNDGGSLTAGIYIKGDGDIILGTDVGGNATYTITQGATTKIITVDDAAVETTVQLVDSPMPPPEVYSGKPDGLDDLGVIIYTDGAISSLMGTVQKDSKVTISSQSDIEITNNIFYEDFDGGPPINADAYDNILGILSWGGDILIGTSCPNDVNIHGTIMARNGVCTVVDYADQGVGPRGTATILGGVITQFYGAFGTFSGSTGVQLSGFGRNFVYDGRMAEGASPPYFPTMRTFVAFTNDITDKVVFEEVKE